MRRTIAATIGTAVLLGILAGAAALENEPALPVYGDGAVEVRLYTDYFCPPCRALEPDVEQLLKELVKRNAVKLILVDVPMNHLTPLFARHFLYALKANNGLEQSFRVRQILQEAAANKEMKTQRQLEALFREKGVAFTIWDPKRVFDRYNSLLKEDKITATPTCVIIRNGHKETAVGGPEIIKALKAIR